MFLVFKKIYIYIFVEDIIINIFRELYIEKRLIEICLNERKNVIFYVEFGHLMSSSLLCWSTLILEC